MRGSLIFHTICENVSSFPLPARIANRSDVDMSTLPAPTFHKNKDALPVVYVIYLPVYVVWMLVRAQRYDHNKQ